MRSFRRKRVLDFPGISSIDQKWFGPGREARRSTIRCEVSTFPHRRRMAPGDFLHRHQICIDSVFILPQYLVLTTLPVPDVGWHFAFGPSSQNLCKGKSLTEGTFMATKKKAKKKKH